MDIKFDKIPWKKILTVASVVVTGISAASGAFTEQKKNMEFEQMKKDLAKLKGDN